MGTRGYRRFDWVAVLRPPADQGIAVGRAFGGMMVAKAVRLADDRRADMQPPLPAAAPPAAPMKLQELAAQPRQREEAEAGARAGDGAAREGGRGAGPSASRGRNGQRAGGAR